MNEIQKWEQQHMMAFIELRDLEAQSKSIEARKAEVRQMLTESMEEHGIVGIDNDYVKITYIGPTESTSLDTKKLRASEPETYNDLVGAYPKVTKKKGHVRIAVKDDTE